MYIILQVLMTSNRDELLSTLPIAGQQKVSASICLVWC